MKVFMIFGKIIFMGGGALVVLLICSALYHNLKLRKEAKKYPAPGKLVEINNKRIHVYCEGKGNTTLVFMPGAGTCNPVTDFKPLWMKMTDDYRIVVVERGGYGWSDTSSSPRDIEIMLEETRTALTLSGEKGPYVLVPHSMSALEAIYWAQTYPKEVKAIIGLDPAIPDIYINTDFELPSKIELFITYFISRIGLTRFMGREGLEKNLPLLTSEVLSNEDKENLIIVFYKSFLTRNMLNEISYVRKNAIKVKRKGIPINLPMYFFIAHDSDRSIISNWKQELSDYVTKIKYGRFKLLDCGHYIHHEKSDVIAHYAKNFLEEILRN